MSDEIRKRLQDRLKELGMGATEVGRRAGKTKDIVNNLVYGKTRSMNVETLQAVASATNTNLMWLLDGKGPKEPTEIGSTVEFDTRPFATDERQMVPEVGEVAAGVWLEFDHYQNEPGEKLGPFTFDPRYPAHAQFSLRVRGTSINNVVEDGGSLHCVLLFEAGIGENDIESGKLVIVKRTRAQGSIFETTAKRLRKTGDWLLEPDSSDPRWQEPIRVADMHDSQDELVEVLALVIGSHQPL